ncbi:hypothetical protein CEXT_561211 [Caerostris extrusa]|uniref:Uncharacterized protein n=1 Tax=Caerostris extrusa TaxID=172846 RepID=A0AAV4M3V2_CAEEX|nr:hypothetical protein CEXT_561211 [Caerostris extrusa]
MADKHFAAAAPRGIYRLTEEDVCPSAGPQCPLGDLVPSLSVQRQSFPLHIFSQIDARSLCCQCTPILQSIFDIRDSRSIFSVRTMEECICESFPGPAINIDRKCVCQWSQEVYWKTLRLAGLPPESTRSILLNTLLDSRAHP